MGDIRADELSKLAKTYLIAKGAFNRAYSQYWGSDLSPCPDDTGWKLLEAFRSSVQLFRFKLNRQERGIEQAAWELFRLQLIGEADYSFDDVAGFTKWYSALKSRIERAIAHLYEFHGDSFGDLTDAYPLAGRNLVERALASHPKSARPRREGFLDEGELRDAVRDALGEAWFAFICSGENYIANALQVACHRCYLHRIHTGRDHRVTWTEEEQSATEFAGHYDP
jgi:hypothetical protein